MDNCNIRVQSVDNGYTINHDSNNPRQNKRLIATDDNDLKKKLIDIVEHMFDEAPTKGN